MGVAPAVQLLKLVALRCGTVGAPPGGYAPGIPTPSSVVLAALKTMWQLR